MKTGRKCILGRKIKCLSPASSPPRPAGSPEWLWSPAAFSGPPRPSRSGAGNEDLLPHQTLSLGWGRKHLHRNLKAVLPTGHFLSTPHFRKYETRVDELGRELRKEGRCRAEAASASGSELPQHPGDFQCGVLATVHRSCQVSGEKPVVLAS